MVCNLQQKMVGLTIILALLFAPISAKGNESTISIEPSRSSYTNIRYQVGESVEDTWTIIKDVNEPKIITIDEKTSNTLFIQESKDGKNWSKSTLFTYEEEAHSWKAKRDGLFVSSLDIYASYQMPIIDTLSCYKMAIGGGVQLNVGIGSDSNISFVSALDYNFGFSNTCWVNFFHDISTSFGIGYAITISHSINIIPQLTYGPVIHIADMNDGEANRLYVDQMIKLSTGIVFQVSRALSFTMSPYGSLLLEKNEFGFLAGIQSGIRILY
jgi:hypothetical protein